MRALVSRLICNCSLAPNTALLLPVKNAVLPNPTVAPTPVANVVPLNVRLASSSSSPEAPAITTLLSVKSETLALLATKLAVTFI